jgi:hypothetical protein
VRATGVMPNLLRESEEAAGRLPLDPHGGMLAELADTAAGEHALNGDYLLRRADPCVLDRELLEHRHVDAVDQPDVDQTGDRGAPERLADRRQVLGRLVQLPHRGPPGNQQRFRQRPLAQVAFGGLAFRPA